MKNATETLKSAITAPVREIQPYARMEIIDPNTTFEGAEVDPSAVHSNAIELFDGETEQTKRATLEPDRWQLNGSWDVYDTTAAPAGTGYASYEIGDENGNFPIPVSAAILFENVSVLQMGTIVFPGGDDGVADTFSVLFYGGDTLLHEVDYTGNNDDIVNVGGFTIANPTEIRVTITKWSVPNRRVRIMEIYPGRIFELTGDDISSFKVIQQVDCGNVSFPYGSCDIEISNVDKKFNPYSESSIFLSIREKQPVKTWMKIKTDNGFEKIPTGVYYQQSGGWDLNMYDLTAKFKLVDIMGMLQKCDYRRPWTETKPTTVMGWLESVVGMIGEYTVTVDPVFENMALTSEVSMRGYDCGTVLRYVAMAVGGFFVQDFETGGLHLAAYDDDSVFDCDFDFQAEAPKLSAYNDCAKIVFQLGDDNNTEYVVNGNAASGNTLTIFNPFIATTAAADIAAERILNTYGKMKITTTDRGNPILNAGDVCNVSVWHDTAKLCRVRQQDIGFTNGIMSRCKTEYMEV